MASSATQCSSRVSARKISAGRSRCSCSFIFFESAHSHADHLPKSNRRAKQQPDQIQRLSTQPVIGQLAQKETEKDRRRNNEPYFGITSKRDERGFLLRGMGALGHPNEL